MTGFVNCQISIKHKSDWQLQELKQLTKYSYYKLFKH